MFTREDLNNVPIPPQSHTRIFRILYTFSTRGIQKLLESTRPDKASGPDQIPACVLNESAFEFAPFSGKLNNWLRVFSTGRRQRVVVNGSSFNWSTVLSGVPQGTVLGPILFLLFINDLPSVVSSNVKLFADDSVLYRRIESSADHHTLLQEVPVAA